MTDTPNPLLVYDRIDANRRTTRLLLAAFALALLPAVSSSAIFIVPYLTHRLATARPGALASLYTNGTLDLGGLPTAILWGYVGANLVAMAIVTLAFIATTVFLIHRYGSRVVLRMAGARPVDPAQEPDLVHVVESLCIGAGLPLPRLFVIESASPNSFATGRNPDDACVVVTRGLLRLLDRHELEGVIAHELSHIGNRDTGLNTTLAALVGALCLPLRVCSAPVLLAFKRDGPLAAIFMVPVVLFLVAAVFGERSPFGFGNYSQMVGSSVKWILRHRHDGFATTTGLYTWWWFVYAVTAPLYLVFVAPVVAMFIRQAVSRQREFLADADAALLTRNPEGLALALVKIGAAGGERLRVGESTVHLYFVDPRSEGSWLHAVFPSHPSLKRRVELLAQMGSGIAPSAIQAAQDAGARVRAAAEEIAEARHVMNPR
jgi:heat shock protein HtpX